VTEGAAAGKPPFDRRDLFLCAAIFAAALLIRLAYLYSYSRSSWWDALVMDPGTHWELARKAAAGGDWTGPYAFFRAPAYIMMLASLIRDFGAGLWTVRTIQAVFGSINAAAVYFICRKFLSLSRGAAAVGGFLLAFFWIAVYYDGELLTEALATFQSLIGLMILMWADFSRQNRRAYSYFLFMVAGVAMGASAISRPNTLVFCAAVPAALLLRSARPWSWPTLRGPLLAAFLFSTHVALTIAPITLMNLVKAHDFVLIASQGGINFWIGNHEGADGRTVVLPIARREIPASFLDSWRDHPWIKEDVWLSSAYGAQSALHRRVRESEISDYWYGQALAWMRAHPGEAALLLLKKTLYLVQATEVSNNRDLKYHRDAFPLLRALGLLRFGMISPLILTGAVIALGRWRQWLWPLLFLGTYGATVIAFFVTTRYRVPMLPEGMCLAALAVDTAGSKWREGAGRWRPLAPLLGLLAAAALLVNIPWPAWNDRPLRSAMHYDLGVALVEKQRNAEAAQEFKTALAIKSLYPEAHFWLGLIAEREGRLEEAEAAYAACLGQAPDYAPAYYQLYLVYARQRLLAAEAARREQLGSRAAAALSRAHELDPAAYPEPGGPPTPGR
jgi:tetratricopeptide (TPR) repeat protein